MGMLVEGIWSDGDRTIQDGMYVRPPSHYGAPLDAETVVAIAAAPGRFHLIASLSCPWSHRATMTRALKGLEEVLPLHIAGGPRTEGYRVGTPDRPWTVPGDGSRIVHLHQLYSLTDPAYTGRVTVPVLWDAYEGRTLSNESVQILRVLDQVEANGNSLEWTLRPMDLVEAIDDIAQRVQVGLSDAVYRAGKARRQDAYHDAVEEVFTTLEFLEERLSQARYLHGDMLTETDLRLWPTLARFDAVYHGHFKCARRRLIDYRNLWDYARDIMTWKGVAETFDEAVIRAAYYGEDRELNPFGIVAMAPALDWTAPHDRGRLGPATVAARAGRQIEVNPTTLHAVEVSARTRRPNSKALLRTDTR